MEEKRARAQLGVTARLGSQARAKEVNGNRANNFKSIQHDYVYASIAHIARHDPVIYRTDRESARATSTTSRPPIGC